METRRWEAGWRDAHLSEFVDAALKFSLLRGEIGFKSELGDAREQGLERLSSVLSVPKPGLCALYLCK